MQPTHKKKKTNKKTQLLFVCRCVYVIMYVAIYQDHIPKSIHISQQLCC